MLLLVAFACSATPAAAQGRAHTRAAVGPVSRPGDARRGSQAQAVTRTEALAIAEKFRSHHWKPTAKNLFHGRDAAGIEVHTPNRNGGHGRPDAECWEPDRENTGVAYKWGGFDTPEKFTAGILAGKAAGDVYTSEKRKRGGAAVGIDCSGFISCCWKLTQKYGTSTLPPHRSPRRPTYAPPIS